MNKLSLLLFLLTVSYTGLAQQSEIDSLNVLRVNESNDTLRMRLYFKLGESYARVNLDSSIWSFNQALVLAQSLQLKWYEVKYLDWLGYVYVVNKDYPKAYEALSEGIELASDSTIQKLHWTGQKMSKKYELGRLANLYTRMGELYGIIGNQTEKIEYFQKARGLSIAARDSVSIQFSDIIISNSYLGEGNIDSALFYANHAEEILEANDRPGDAAFYWLKGTILLQKGDSIHSKDYLESGLKIAEENHYYLANLYFSLAKLHNLYFRKDSALIYAERAKLAEERLGDGYGLIEVYKLLADIYREKEIYDSAFVYVEQSILLSDSLNSTEKKNLMSFQNMGFNQQLRVQELEKDKIKTQSQIRTYALTGGIAVFLIIALLLFRNNRIRSKANAVLEGQNRKIEEQKKDVERTLKELKATQSQLIQSEKMASLGELTAGIAHEIQNPLNFVNNFSEVSNELIDEMAEEMAKGDVEEATAIAADIKANLSKITHHGKRADAIVKGMLAHSRSGKGEKVSTDLNALAEEYLKLSYHGLRARDKSFNADFKTDFDPNLPKVNVVPQDIGRVLLNLINNAFQAVNERSKRDEPEYKPTVTVKTELTANGQQLIAISDNGPGIPDSIKDKIFQPFFTTKPTGQGTGLGLSLSYDIVKAHGGKLTVQSQRGSGTVFTIELPL